MLFRSNEIVPVFPAASIEEMLELPNPRKSLADLISFMGSESLSGSANPIITLAEADVPGIGRATDVELRINGRFRVDGDLCTATDLGYVNISAMARRAEALIDLRETRVS